MYCQRCWHDFVIKDVTFEQVTLNVTDMDKIDIVSSQAVLEMSSFSMILAVWRPQVGRIS